MQADSARAVRDALREKNFFIVAIDEPKVGLHRDIKIPGLGDGRPNLKAVAVFSRQIATMINSGLPLVQSLSIMQRQVEHPGFRKILAQVRTDVEGGVTFSDA